MKYVSPFLPIRYLPQLLDHSRLWPFIRLDCTIVFIGLQYRLKVMKTQVLCTFSYVVSDVWVWSLYASVVRGFHPFDAFFIKLNFEKKNEFCMLVLGMESWCRSKVGVYLEESQERKEQSSKLRWWQLVRALGWRVRKFLCFDKLIALLF